jgi:hypothetical protein
LDLVTSLFLLLKTIMPSLYAIACMPFHFFWDPHNNDSQKVSQKTYDAILTLDKDKKRAKQFFKTLDQQLAHYQSGEPLPPFMDEIGRGYSRLQVTMTHLEVLHSEILIDEENKRSVETIICDLITAEPDAVLADTLHGQTLLHLAVSYHASLKIIDALLQTAIHKNYHDSVINAQDQNGFTPLHLAVRQGDEGMNAIEALLQANADVNIPNHSGEFPLDVAAALCLSPKLYDEISKKTDPNNPAIWEKALAHPLKFNRATISEAFIKTLPLDQIDPKYSLMHPLVRTEYDTLYKKEAEELLTIAKNDPAKAQGMVIIPVLLNRLLRSNHYEAFYSAVLLTEKGELAYLAIRNHNYLDHLCQDNTLTQLTELSQYPDIARYILKHYRDRVKQHPANTVYLTALQKHYKAPAATFKAIENAVANALTLRDIKKVYGIFERDGKTLSTFTAEDYQWMLTTKGVLGTNKVSRIAHVDTPLHIAIRHEAEEMVKTMLRYEGSSLWCNHLNEEGESPLSLALAAESPNMEFIGLLYDKTKTALLSAYLPPYLTTSFDYTTQEMRALLDGHPYLLNQVLVHSECRKQYPILSEIVGQDTRAECKTDRFFEALCQDPITMLVGLRCAVFRKYVETILKDAEKVKYIAKFIYDCQGTLRLSNAEHLLLSLLQQGLSLKKTTEEKQHFLHSLLIDKHAKVFPRVALYALKTSEPCLSDSMLAEIALHYVPLDTLKRFDMHRDSRDGDQTEHDHRVWRENYIKITRIQLASLMRVKEKQAQVLHEIHQLSPLPSDQMSLYIKRHRDPSGGTLLHRIMDVPDGILHDTLATKTLWYDEGTDISTVVRTLLMNTKDSTLLSEIDNAGNTFLHIVARRGGESIEHMKNLFNTIKMAISWGVLDASYLRLVQALCNSKNHQGQTPLQIGLEACHANAIDLLAPQTTEETVWTDALHTDRKDQGNLNSIKELIQSDFQSLKNESRLLNDRYRDIFQVLTQNLSFGRWDEQIERLHKLFQTNELAAYALANYPRLFEYLLECPKPNYIIGTLQDKPLALSEALDNEKFYTALQQSPHHMAIIQSWANTYEVSAKDTQEKTVSFFNKAAKGSFEALVAALKTQLKERLALTQTAQAHPTLTQGA